MRLLLVRHGDPNYELDCLTELGHEQAKIVAKRLLREGIQEIYCSPLGRARQTAQPFAEMSGISEIHILDFMEEIRYGREDALYQSGNPWLVAMDLIHEGKNLQVPNWQEYPGYADNTATIDAVVDGVPFAGFEYFLPAHDVGARAPSAHQRYIPSV